MHTVNDSNSIKVKVFSNSPIFLKEIKTILNLNYGARLLISHKGLDQLNHDVLNKFPIVILDLSKQDLKLIIDKINIDHIKTNILIVTEYDVAKLSKLDIGKLTNFFIEYTPIVNKTFINTIQHILKSIDCCIKIKSFQNELESIKEDLKDHNKQLRHFALYDSLTDTPNRYFFEKSTKQLINIAQRYQRKFSLILIDIDNFKWINDKFGHNVGDEVLKQVVVNFKQILRRSDIIARLGGDEFAILLSEIKKESDAGIVASKILDAFDTPLKIGKNRISAGMSIGITSFTYESPKSFNLLMEEADIAMYKAKKSGKNRYDYFSTNQKREYDFQNTLNHELHNALQRNEFFVNYQPIIDIRNNMIAGFEALLRWNNRTLGNIPPLSFIGIAEQTGIINEIGLWIIDSVCKQLSIWKKMNANIFVSINVSPVQLKNMRFGQDLSDITGKHSIRPEDIELEITESRYEMNSGIPLEKYVKFLDDFQNRLSIDDFGSKFSTISRLSKLKFNTLKIDGSLIADIETNLKNKVIAKSMIMLAKELSMNVIAEKVENKKQLEFLQKNKCFFAQGYYFYKPLNADEATKLLTV